MLEEVVKEIGFDMPSDRLVGSLLGTLCASKPGGRFLELGTGIGLSLAWMMEGMNEDSKIISLDNDTELTKIAHKYFNDHQQVEILCTDGFTWIEQYDGPSFDLIFADTWPGKYYLLDETLALLKVGGYYVIDDMNPQDNWPAGHHEKAIALVDDLSARQNLQITKLNWSTGVVIATKLASSF